MTLPCRSSCKLDRRRRRLARNGLEDPLEPWTSEWYSTDRHDDETYPEETDWTEDYYETDDYNPNDRTFSDHYPALLDQIVETQEGDTSKLETVQEAVAAANAAADMSRRTWTQSRQLMKDVHRSRGNFPVSKGNMMEVDQGKGKPLGKKGRSSKRKGKSQGKSKGKGDVTGLVTVLHTMEERASVSTRSARGTRTLHDFDKLTRKATSMIGSQVQVLLQSPFHPCRILPVLTSTESSFSILEPTMSMGGVDLFQRIQERYASTQSK